MDLNRLNHSHQEARLRYEEMRREHQSENSDRVRGARQALARLSEMRAERLRQGRAHAAEARIAEAKEHHGSADQIEISDRARIMARQHEAQVSYEEDAQRTQRVAELKQSHAAGRLNTPEAIERAAAGLLRHGE